MGAPSVSARATFAPVNALLPFAPLRRGVPASSAALRRSPKARCVCRRYKKCCSGKLFSLRLGVFYGLSV